MALPRIQKAKAVARLCVSTHKEFKSDEKEVRRFVEGITAAEGIYRVPIKYSGFISKAALTMKEKNPQYIPTKEHYFGRRASADKIYEQLEKGKTVKRIFNVIMSRSRVHYTTAAENELLKKYSHLPWRDAYKAAGIELVPYRPKRGRQPKGVQFKDIVYNSPSEAAKAVGKSTQTIRNYCIDQNKMEWNYV